MKTQEVTCKICGKEFLTRVELIGTPSRSLCIGQSSVYRMKTSDDGVCFKAGNIYYWFCNECWELIRK